MKKLFVVLFIVLALPVFGALSVHESQPFNPVAVAGHSTAGGGWCQCGCLDCICFPDEVPLACGGGNAASPDGGGVMLLLFAAALALRFALK